MHGSWTDNVLLWTNFVGFILDIWNVLMTMLTIIDFGGFVLRIYYMWWWATVF